MGIKNTWAVYWNYVIFRENGLTIVPTRPFTSNIGFDGSGVHSGYAPWMQDLQADGNFPLTIPNEVVVDEKLNNKLFYILASSGASFKDKVLFKLYKIFPNLVNKI